MGFVNLYFLGVNILFHALIVYQSCRVEVCSTSTAAPAAFIPPSPLGDCMQLDWAVNLSGLETHKLKCFVNFFR